VPEANANCPTCPSTLAYTEGEEFVFYVYGVENGCVSLPDSIIVIMQESELIIPNAFTPNDDGLNDEFNILNPIFFPVFSFRIFNRWGQEVFATSDVLKGWDGTYDSINQEIGMYVWMIIYEKANEPGKQYILRGTVTLLR
jgi:gliding motility-associated-like protein